ncbi:MAG: DUF222 domain-containing protein [Acidimicrobiia bacterium]
MEELMVLEELIERIDDDVFVDFLDTGWAVFDKLRSRLTVATGTFDAEGRYAIAGAVSMGTYLSAHSPLGRESTSVATLARKLRSMPTTQAAWLDGSLTGGQVRIISDHVRADRVGLFADHEDGIVPALVGLSVKHTDQAMTHWRTTAENLIDTPPREAAGIRITPLAGENLWKINGTLSERDAKMVNDAIALFRIPPVDGDTTTPAQRTAHALADSCAFSIAHHDTDKMPRNAQSLGLMAWAEHAQDPARGAMTLDGEPISRRLYEELACFASVHRILFEGPSTPVDLGRSTRIVSKELFKAVAARDHGCRYPGCDRPVAWCEAHHVKHWMWDGRTDYWNLALLCARHHHLIHRIGWKLEMDEDFVVTVTTPDGRRLISHPPPQLQ